MSEWQVEMIVDEDALRETLDNYIDPLEELLWQIMYNADVDFYGIEVGEVKQIENE